MVLSWMHTVYKSLHHQLCPIIVCQFIIVSYHCLYEQHSVMQCCLINVRLIIVLSLLLSVLSNNCLFKCMSLKCLSLSKCICQMNRHLLCRVAFATENLDDKNNLCLWIQSKNARVCLWKDNLATEPILPVWMLHSSTMVGAWQKIGIHQQRNFLSSVLFFHFKYILKLNG